jgi:hypothetical protein
MRPKMVGVDGHVRIVEIDLHSCAPLADIGQRGQKRTARQKAMGLELLVDPLEEAVGERLGRLLGRARLAGAVRLSSRICASTAYRAPIHSSACSACAGSIFAEQTMSV